MERKIAILAGGIYINKLLCSLMMFMLLFMTSCQTVTDNKINVEEVNNISPIENSFEHSNNDIQVVDQVTDNPVIFDPVTEYILKAGSFFEQEVPELEAYSMHISERSNGKAYLIVECDGRAENVNGIVATDELSGKYYSVYVGEQWEDHKVNWDWFFVSEDFDEILWYYLPESEVYTLSEWRNSSHYRQLGK